MPDNRTTVPRATPLMPRKKAIVVGAAGGIGAQLARRLAREGYVLAVVDRSKQVLEALCDDINQLQGEVSAVPMCMTLKSIKRYRIFFGIL